MPAKIILVTGANGGLGIHVTKALLEAGHTVIGLARRIQSSDFDHPHFTALPASLDSLDAAKKAVETILTRFGKLDALVHTVGGFAGGQTVADTDDTTFQRMLEVNLTSAFRLCQLAGTEMLNRRRGKIVNIASMMSFQGGVRIAAYVASKGGIAQMTKALANEWAPRNVQVNAIAPGYFATENTAALQKDETRNRQILDRIPAGRWGEPDDLAGAAVFLASPASNYVTGTVLVVDGGWLSR